MVNFKRKTANLRKDIGVVVGWLRNDLLYHPDVLKNIV